MVEDNEDFVVGKGGKYDADMVLIGAKYGLVDNKGVIIIPPTYDNVLYFAEGISVAAIASSYDKSGAPVGLKYGFINNQGKIVIPLIYYDAERFYNGEAFVTMGDDSIPFRINIKGEKVN